MTDTIISQSEPALVPIDISKARHEVLIAVPGKKRLSCFAHGAPSYSGIGASGKPGAVHHLLDRVFHRYRSILVKKTDGLEFRRKDENEALP